MHKPPRVSHYPRDRPHATGDAARASRFNVVFSRTTGSRRQRAKHEGTLVVRYDVAYLYDTDNKECVLRCKASGAGPNTVFARMQKAHRGADWRVGTELSLCGFDVVVGEVMELHLIPYNEDVDAAAASENEHDGTEAAAAAAAMHSADTSFLRARAAASPPQVLIRPSVAAATESVSWPVDGAVRLASCTPVRQDVLASTFPNRRIDVDGTAAQATVQQPPCRRRRRRSPASLARELRRCYPQFFSN